MHLVFSSQFFLGLLRGASLPFMQASPWVGSAALASTLLFSRWTMPDALIGAILAQLMGKDERKVVKPANATVQSIDYSAVPSRREPRPRLLRSLRHERPPHLGGRQPLLHRVPLQQDLLARRRRGLSAH